MYLHMIRWWVGVVLIVGGMVYGAPDGTTDGAIGGDAPPPLVTWETLQIMTHDTREIPDPIWRLNHQTIRVQGFMVPLEMDGYINNISEFLLVPDPFSCIHVPPPPLNQIIHVVMTHGIPINMDYRGVEITGVFSISDDGVRGYRMKGHAAKEANIEYNDPIMDMLEIDF